MLAWFERLRRNDALVCDFEGPEQEEYIDNVSVG